MDDQKWHPPDMRSLLAWDSGTTRTTLTVQEPGLFLRLNLPSGVAVSKSLDLLSFPPSLAAPSHSPLGHDYGVRNPPIETRLHSTT